MKKIFKTFLLTLLLLNSFFNLNAQTIDLPALHVQGRQFVLPDGTPILLHGVMDTPNCWFNGGRWGWYNYSGDDGIDKCIDYFDKLYTHITDTVNGTWCNLFRLHLDPCWTNDPKKSETGPESGEANISRFSSTRLQHYLEKLYIPLALNALEHGLYVIMRPPGVCPGRIQVGGDYQKYLSTVWDIVSKDPTIQKYSGQIMIELANEPVTVLDAEGNDKPVALHDFFQPIVNRIRYNKFNGIILVPGAGYQSSYSGYAQYPIEDKLDNMGYAVHVYPGWYGNSDDNCSAQSFITNFRNQVPVVDNYPIVVTEIDWSPGHVVYDEHGNPQKNSDGSIKSENLGTWATATTSKWGEAFKAMKDHYGNISMTLTGTGDFIDCDAAVNGYTELAFDGEWESCAGACAEWYDDYAWENYLMRIKPAGYWTCTGIESKRSQYTMSPGNNAMVSIIATFKDGHTEDVASDCKYQLSNQEASKIVRGRAISSGNGDNSVIATYTDRYGNTFSAGFDLNVTYFPLVNGFFNPSIWDSGTFSESNGKVTMKPYGFSGWEFANPIDISQAAYIVVEFANYPPDGIDLRVFDESSYWSTPVTSWLGSGKKQKISISSLKRDNGKALDKKHIYRVGFWVNGNKTFYLKSVYLSEDGNTPLSSENILFDMSDCQMEKIIYTNLAGVEIPNPEPGQILIRTIVYTNGFKTSEIIVK